MPAQAARDRRPSIIKYVVALSQTPIVPPAPVQQQPETDHPIMLALDEAGLGYYIEPQLAAWQRHMDARTNLRVWGVRYLLDALMVGFLVSIGLLWYADGRLTWRTFLELVIGILVFSVLYYFATVRRQATWNEETMMAAELYPRACESFAASRLLKNRSGLPAYQVSAPALLRRSPTAPPVASYLQLHYLGSESWPAATLVVDYRPKIN